MYDSFSSPSYGLNSRAYVLEKKNIVNAILWKISEITCVCGVAVRCGWQCVCHGLFFKVRLLQALVFVIFLSEGAGCAGLPPCYLRSTFSPRFFICERAFMRTVVPHALFSHYQLVPDWILEIRQCFTILTVLDWLLICPLSWKEFLTIFTREKKKKKLVLTIQDMFWL